MRVTQHGKPEQGEGEICVDEGLCVGCQNKNKLSRVLCVHWRK